MWPMSSQFADFVEGTPGRFVPSEMRGQLVEAEHLARYWWAATAAHGRRVLDAGCGMGYGAELMARAGATSVDAVDVAESVVEAARAAAEAAVTFAAADVRSLPFADDAFDLVVCFEVIEHIDGQEAALDELRRVTAPGGVLLISSPNREAYVPGNPHHVHEYTPAELEAALRPRWANVALMRQHNLTANVLLSEAGLEGADGALVDAEVRKLAATALDEEVYTVAVASDGALPDVRQFVTLATPVEVREWLERFREQQSILQAQADALAELQQSSVDRNEALIRLADAERQLTEQAQLEARLAQLASDAAALREQLDGARRALAAQQASVSWRITRPLRAAKRVLR
jgi:SAM-dependent methyltransferase